MTSKTVSITLLKKAYHIKCAENEAPMLEKISRYLDQSMHQIKKQGTKDYSDIAVLAALNIASELYHYTKKAKGSVEEQTINSDFLTLQKKLKKTLGSFENAEITT